MSFYKLIIVFLVGLTGIATNTFAQTTEEIRLLDEDTGLPIEGLTFTYGSQSGISDTSGTISFVLLEAEVMKLSHLNYGVWEWKEKELQEILQQKVYYRSSTMVNLYPVTVIAVRSDLQPDEKVNIDYQDRMEHDGAAILHQIPSISTIKKSGSYGFDPVFRGFKYDQLNIVMNGAQSATAACPNRMDPPTSQMAPNMMDRIEVLKGPYALRYGIGFGGTINFIPSRIRFTDEPDVYGRFSSAFQSNGNVMRGEGQVGLSNRSYDLSLFGAWAQGDDYQAGNGQKVPADFARGSFGANLGLKISGNQQLRMSAMYNRARDVDFPALPMDLREDDTWLFNVRHDITVDNKYLKSWNTTVFGSFVDHLMNNLLKPLNPRMLNAETAATTYNYGGRTEGVWHFSNGKLFAGADLRTEGAEGTRVREFLMGPNAGKVFYDNAWQNGRISKTGIFGEHHLKGDVFQYVFSLRLEVNNADVKDPSSEFIQVFPKTEVTQLNPALSAGMLKKFGQHIQAGLWLGRAQRSGSLTERYINYFPVGQDPFEMLGNPQLDPEVNNQLDLTFKWATEKTAISVDLFGAYLQDYISSVIDTSLRPRLPMSPGVRRFINIKDAFKTGFEVNWRQKLAVGLQHQMGIAYTYAQDLEREEPLPEIAPLDFRYTLRGSYLDGKLQPEAIFRYVLEQSRISTEYGERVTPAFTLLDVKLSFELSKTVRFGAGVRNLFDETYYEHLNRAPRGMNDPIFERGRNIFASVNITFD